MAFKYYNTIFKGRSNRLQFYLKKFYISEVYANNIYFIRIFVPVYYILKYVYCISNMRSCVICTFYSSFLPHAHKKEKRGGKNPFYTGKYEKNSVKN